MHTCVMLQVVLLLVLLWITFGGMFVDLLHDKLNHRCHSMTESEFLHGLVLPDGRNASAVAYNMSLHATDNDGFDKICLLYTSPSPRDRG